jgi:hypothetical protein
MAKRGLASRIPVWVRVPGVIALVLAGVLLGAVLLNAARDGGGHGRPGEHTQMDRDGHTSSGGGHGAGDGGGHGPATQPAAP